MCTCVPNKKLAIEILAWTVGIIGSLVILGGWVTLAYMKPLDDHSNKTVSVLASMLGWPFVILGFVIGGAAILAMLFGVGAGAVWLVVMIKSCLVERCTTHSTYQPVDVAEVVAPPPAPATAVVEEKSPGAS